MQQLTNAELSAAQRGDPVGYRSIYSHLAPSVLGYLKGRGVDDPEGLTQEVFLSLFGRLKSLDGGVGALRTLTFSIAHARVVDHIRQAVRTAGSVEYDPDTDERSTQSAEDAALAGFQFSAISPLLRQLNDDQRDVLLLRIVADLPFEQVAEIMGRSVGATKQLQKRAVDNLRSLVVTKDALTP